MTVFEYWVKFLSSVHGLVSLNYKVIWFVPDFYLEMTRGSQRERAREKNLKKQQDTDKNKKSDGLTVEQRKIRDAEVMREKQRKKQEDVGQIKK